MFALVGSAFKKELQLLLLLLLSLVLLPVLLPVSAAAATAAAVAVAAGPARCFVFFETMRVLRVLLVAARTAVCMPRVLYGAAALQCCFAGGALTK